jgi:hypothetical protein
MMTLDRLSITGVAVIAMLALTAGCSNSGESQSEAANDVASARQDASQAVTQARQDAATDNNSAAKDVDAKQMKLNSVAAQGAYDVEIAKAEGDHKIATEKCGMLSSDALKACTSQADADYDAAKARAKATLDAA